MFSKKKRKATRVTTFVGQRTEILGDVHFTGCIQVDGVIKGNVTADGDGSSALSLTELGSIQGEVKAPYLELNGSVQGDVYAYEHVELAAKACITGNVYYTLIEMANGAQVNGQLVHGAGESGTAGRANPGDDGAGAFGDPHREADE